MAFTAKQVEEKEDSFYVKWLSKAEDFVDGKKDCDGVRFRALTAAAGVVAKQRQTRGAMRALDFQIEREVSRMGINTHGVAQVEKK